MTVARTLDLFDPKAVSCYNRIHTPMLWELSQRNVRA